MNLDFQPKDDAEIFAKLQNLQTLAISKKKKVACIIQGRKLGTSSEEENRNQTFGGFNIEFSSSDIIHAERMALLSCISEGYYPEEIYVTSSKVDGTPTFLCGYCRQLLHEVNNQILITIFTFNGEIFGKTQLHKVFPNAKNTKEKNIMFMKYCSGKTRFDIDWSKI